MGQKVLVLPPPCPKPPAVFLSPPCPLVISLIPLFLPQGRMPAGVRERVISKQLRVGHIYLSLGAGPFFQPLSSPPNVPIARAPPSQFPSFLGVIIKEKKKKKASAQVGISRELGISARQLFASRAHVPLGTEQAKAFVVC